MRCPTSLRLTAYLGALVVAGGPVAHATSMSLLAPRDRAMISFPDPSRAVVAFTWRAVPGVSEYRFTIATTADLNRPIVKRNTAESSLSVRGLAEGAYFWRVEAAGPKGTAPEPSGVQTFTIKAGAP